jgi:hypothetical protein
VWTKRNRAPQPHRRPSFGFWVQAFFAELFKFSTFSMSEPVSMNSYWFNGSCASTRPARSPLNLQSPKVEAGPCFRPRASGTDLVSKSIKTSSCDFQPKILESRPNGPWPGDPYSALGGVAGRASVSQPKFGRTSTPRPPRAWQVNRKLRTFRTTGRSNATAPGESSTT